MIAGLELLQLQRLAGGQGKFASGENYGKARYQSSAFSCQRELPATSIQPKTLNRMLVAGRWQLSLIAEG